MTDTSSEQPVEQFVGYTRYLNPQGRLIVHVWGPPQPTRAKAQTILNRVTRCSVEQDPVESEKVERKVVRLHA